MVTGLSLSLFDFQEKAVMDLLDLTVDSGGRQTIVVKSPTGSGKTIILIGFVDEYLDKAGEKTAFVWLCPGKGDLEEQSRKKMRSVAPHLATQDLFDSLHNGFAPGSTTFINWELVTKKGNTAIRDSERKNLFDRIAEAHRAGTDFIVIIDEEHSHNTAKAAAVIDAFTAKHIIRVSATAVQNRRYAFCEIDELDVIDAGLITKAIYVNEGIRDNIEIGNDYDYLLDLADAKRQAIFSRYKGIQKDIRPLVLIQFPNAQPQTVEAVEKKLSDMGYTYENGMVSKWMSEDKRDLPDNLTENDATPVFLLMKQAISTGWDCPRAKILVKLREGMSEQFEIQTIGRIRRMPEARHYDDDLLDFCYVYTFDEKYKAGLLSSIDRAYETRRLFLKEKCKAFTLEKQNKNLEIDSLGEREVIARIHDALCRKYHLFGTDGSAKNLGQLAQNRQILQGHGYQFGNEMIGRMLHGQFARTGAVADADAAAFYRTRQRVNTTVHGIRLLHEIDRIKTIVGMPTGKVKSILERLFRKGVGGHTGADYRGSKRSGKPRKYQILALETVEFYAFVVNNAPLLREEFREVTSKMETQISLQLNPRTSAFKIPEQDFFKYDPGVKGEVDYLTNAYREYTSGYATTVTRSTCEMLFERYCEGRDDIEWVYKNGDAGQQYFSIVYVDALQNQRLFYADYIVKMKSGDVWVIETKGGEIRGQNKNIDVQIENKFNAFKEYAAEHSTVDVENRSVDGTGNMPGLNWAFVRDKDGRLYMNNTVFALDMNDGHWVGIEEMK